ncbi:hypothetical protein D7V86_24240 [bacterium D16-51]|nr:hypothetical protein D7V96_23565 [bacterium D16-59]RKI54071.1 hypothetical protein D7V86_24240 [bacterium D16-51]
MFWKPKNATRNSRSLSMEGSEITILLCDFTDLIAKETMLEQVAHAVAKDNSDSETITNLKAILQIDTPKKKLGS